MKRVFALAFIFSCVAIVSAQNLVPNGSFEEYYECPPSFGWWADVVGWTSPYTASADYFNRCADGVVCSVPFNNMGYQEPAEGDAYMGLATYDVLSPDYRELIATQLTEPLIPGIPVYLSFKVSPGGYGSWVSNSAAWKAKGPGMKFYQVLPQDWQTYLYPNTAALDMSEVLEDTSAWVTVSGTYIPDSAYTQLVITNFFEDSLSSPSPLLGSGTLSASYAFIDQVCVSLDPAYCASWTGVTAPANHQGLVVQNPFADVLTITASDKALSGERLRLVDASGRTVWSGVWPRGAEVWSVQFSDLEQGVFLLTGSGSAFRFNPIKVVHVSP